MDYVNYDYKFRTRFRDTDAYGIIHHSNYFCYFEEARYQFSVELLSFSPDMMNGTQIKFPVIEASCKYKNSISYSQNYYVVHLKFRIIDLCKIEFLYKLTDEAKLKTYAVGRTVHAFVNEENQLCLNVPSSFQKTLEGLKD